MKSGANNAGSFREGRDATSFFSAISSVAQSGQGQKLFENSFILDLRSVALSLKELSNRENGAGTSAGAGGDTGILTF